MYPVEYLVYLATSLAFNEEHAPTVQTPPRRTALPSIARECLSTDPSTGRSFYYEYNCMCTVHPFFAPLYLSRPADAFCV